MSLAQPPSPASSPGSVPSLAVSVGEHVYLVTYSFLDSASDMVFGRLKVTQEFDNITTRYGVFDREQGILG